MVVNGGGFVVTDFSHNVVFIVDGCGILGSKGELMVKDGDGEQILFISRKVMGHNLRNSNWQIVFSLLHVFQCLPELKLIDWD